MPITPFPTKIGSLGNPDPKQATSTYETDIVQQSLSNSILSAVGNEATARANADAALTSALGQKLDANLVVSDPAFPVANNSKIPTQLAIKNYVGATATPMIVYYESSASFAIGSAFFKPGYVYTLVNTGNASINLSLADAYLPYSFVQTEFNVSLGNILIPAKTAIELIVVPNTIHLKRKNAVVTGARSAAVSGLIYSDSFFELHWDAANRQPFYVYKNTNVLAVAWQNRVFRSLIVQGNTTLTNGISGTRFSTGRNTAVAPGTQQYFTRTGGIDVANIMSNYGAFFSASLMRELYSAGFPSYNIELFMGDQTHVSFAITVTK